MPRYFTTISHLNNSKNKLQEDVQQFFKKNQNRVFDDRNMRNRFISYMENHIKRANEFHNRCKPIDLSRQKAGESFSKEKKLIYFFPGGHFMITEENLSYAKE